MQVKEERMNAKDFVSGKQMVKLQKEQNNITIGDVANALGISKTTVSRAISGKGRIGEGTRQRVFEYISEKQYYPNVMAKGLAKSKTYNIGWEMPGDSGISELPFFQRCMLGISEITAEEDYDILISMVFEHDISQLKRAVKNRKVDGIILGQALMKDDRIRFLKESGIPFVVIGSVPDEDVVQIDNDHIGACKELTSLLASKGIRHFGLIGSDENHVVNQARCIGFEMGLKEQGIEVNPNMIYMNCRDETAAGDMLGKCLKNGVECIICMDDEICHNVLNEIHRAGLDIPKDIQVASFYHSMVLEQHRPEITSLRFDPKELGAVAGRILFDYIAGKEVPRKTQLAYEIFLKDSTRI